MQDTHGLEIDMPNYPVQVQAKPYGGRKEKMKHEFLLKCDQFVAINDFLNSEMAESQAGTARTFTLGEIEDGASVSTETAREYCMRADGGHNGITITR
jgi:hypothetical protein